MKKTLIALATSGLILAMSAGLAAAAPNPNGTGQPSAECGSDGATMMPTGFGMDGFATAESHYAGSDGTPSQANANSDNAVSQYDVACYQVTQNHS